MAEVVMRTYAGLGVTQVWVGSNTADLPEWVERVDREVLPRVREL